MGVAVGVAVAVAVGVAAAEDKATSRARAAVRNWVALGLVAEATAAAATAKDMEGMVEEGMEAI